MIDPHDILVSKDDVWEYLEGLIADSERAVLIERERDENPEVAELFQQVEEERAPSADTRQFLRAMFHDLALQPEQEADTSADKVVQLPDNLHASLEAPSSPRFDWYFRRERPPMPELAANHWRRLTDRCELLYESRSNLIAPLVETPVHALKVNGALIWHGFAPHASRPTSAKARVVPVFLHGLYPSAAIHSGDELDKLLAQAWARNFLLWLHALLGDPAKIEALGESLDRRQEQIQSERESFTAAASRGEADPGAEQRAAGRQFMEEFLKSATRS